jgi:hypothetical protein
MSSIKEKLNLIVLDYYDECSTISEYVYFDRIRFLGIENINNNLLLRFELKNGKQMRRLINDGNHTYKHVGVSDGHKEIVFTDICYTDH